MSAAPDIGLDAAPVDGTTREGTTGEVTTREGTAFERMIERHIRECTRGRIRGLEVTVSDNRVTVRGVCPTYYMKQLAIHALLESVESDMTPVVEIAVA